MTQEQKKKKEKKRNPLFFLSVSDSFKTKSKFDALTRLRESSSMQSSTQSTSSSGSQENNTSATCSNCGAQTSLVHGTLGPICGPCYRESSS
jgi:hypothetical protein